MRYLVVYLVILLALPLSLSAQQPTTITYGETVSGSISSDAPIQEYQFEGTTGDVITISMTAEDGSSLDSYLRLLDSTGSVLTENDDASDITIDAAITNFELPATDTYTIQATRFGLEGGISEGDFQLMLTLGDSSTQTSTPEATSQPAQNATDVTNSIGYNSQVQGFISLELSEERWEFTGTEGDRITIRMQRSDSSASLDTFLYLLDNEGNELAQNDDSVFSDDLSTSEILNFELPYTGTYIIVASRYGGAEGTSSGAYTLEIFSDAASIETTDTPESTQASVPAEGQPIGYGAFVTDSVEANAAPNFYNFEAQAGDIVTISVKRQNGDVDPALTLRDGSGNVVASNSRFNGASDARIVAVQITNAGTYHIEVIAERGSSGEYVLYLMEAETTVSVITPEPTAEGTETPTEEATSAPDFSNAALTITLSWDTASDFDLQVSDPDSTTIDYFSSESASGGAFGGDANGGCSDAAENPSETIYWETEPPAGTYEIGVAYVFPCGATDPVAFTITVALNGEVVETIEGELNQGQFQSYEWTLE